MKLCTSWLLLVGYFLGTTYGWDNEELEIFDLVEEIDTNFYTLLGVPEDANATDIRKAYRRLSLQLHPDKNDAPDAEIKFRQLVAVYDVLRDHNKRLRYDQVLQNGLPDWRQAVFYYRRVRKMGLAEMSLILFVLVTVGQYVVAWAAYLEKKYTAQLYLEARLKKLQKKQRKGKYDGPALPETIVVEIPTPSVWDTLPFQLPRLIWFLVTLFPRSMKVVREYWTERQRRKLEEDSGSAEEEEVVEVEQRAPRRRKGKFTLPVLSDPDGTILNGIHCNDIRDRSENKPKPNSSVAGGLWTDDDLAELIRLVKKFPPGTAARWEKIAQAMKRSVAEVTFMSKKVKEDGYRFGRVSEQNEDDSVVNEDEESKPGKVKTRGGKLPEDGDGSGWSQLQQKALEIALTKFPKGGSIDRWEKIGKCVPGKSKEECMLRYKQLVELVKKKKGTTDNRDASPV